MGKLYVNYFSIKLFLKKKKTQDKKNQAYWRASVLYYCPCGMTASSKLTSQLPVDVLTLCGVEQNSAHITTCRLLFSSSSRQWRTAFDFHWVIAESPVTQINPEGRRWACENLPKESSRYFTFRHKVVLWKKKYISFKNFYFSDFYWNYGS